MGLFGRSWHNYNEAIALSTCVSAVGYAASVHGFNSAFRGVNSLMNGEKPTNLNAEGVKKERAASSPEKTIEYPEGDLGKEDIPANTKTTKTKGRKPPHHKDHNAISS